MKVRKPVFIIGTGRSGSTIFHKILSHHPNLVWLSGLCRKYPDKPFINGFLMKMVDYPMFGEYLRRKFIPGECYEFWEYYCKGFSLPNRDLLPEDVTIKAKNKIQNVLSKMLTIKKNRLLIKITGWPRIGYLSEIYDDAKFIHILRDGRAVANSLINWPNWWWRGPQNWRWEMLTPSQKKEWERFDKSYIALAGIQWKILIKAVGKAKKFVDQNNFLEIKYEELCSNPIGVFREVLEFCELEWTQEFENQIKNHSLKNTNYKWRRELSSSQQQVIEGVVCDFLEMYGYSCASSLED